MQIHTSKRSAIPETENCTMPPKITVITSRRCILSNIFNSAPVKRKPIHKKQVTSCCCLCCTELCVHFDVRHICQNTSLVAVDISLLHSYFYLQMTFLKLLIRKCTFESTKTENRKQSDRRFRICKLWNNPCVLFAENQQNVFTKIYGQ